MPIQQGAKGVRKEDFESGGLMRSRIALLSCLMLIVGQYNNSRDGN